MIDPGLEALDFWYGAGLRSLGPVWSRPNAFGEGVPFASPSSPDTGPGLTDAGRGLVRRCSELGVLVDLSHLNEAGFWDVARLDLGPLVASHSGSHALAAHSRNLTDKQLDAIGASGGLVGIVYATPFLRSDFVEDPDTPLSLIVDHARHIAGRIGSSMSRSARTSTVLRSRPRSVTSRTAPFAPGVCRRRLHRRGDGRDRVEQLAPRPRRLVVRLKSSSARTPARRRAKHSSRARLAQLVEHFTCNEEV